MVALYNTVLLLTTLAPGAAGSISHQFPPVAEQSVAVGGESVLWQDELVQPWYSTHGGTPGGPFHIGCQLY